MLHFNSLCGFCLRMRGKWVGVTFFSVGLGSTGRVGLKKTVTSGFEGIVSEFRVGLGSTGCEGLKSSPFRFGDFPSEF